VTLTILSREFYTPGFCRPCLVCPYCRNCCPSDHFPGKGGKPSSRTAIARWVIFSRLLITQEANKASLLLRDAFRALRWATAIYVWCRASGFGLRFSPVEPGAYRDRCYFVV